MRKTILTLVFIFSVPLILVGLVACGNNKTENNQTAAVPVTTTCLYNNSYSNNGNNCNSRMYNHPGFQPYPVHYGLVGFNNANFCGCPSGTRPVYHNTAGLGCAQEQLLAPVAGFLGYYYLQGANQQWVNIPQVSNIPSPAPQSCPNGVALVCQLNSPNSCGSGYACHPAYMGSSLGFCVRY